MTFLNWIIKALKWLKEVFDLVKWILLIVSLVTTFGWFNSCSNSKEERTNLTTILENAKKEIKTISGNDAEKTKQWNIERSELKKEISEKEAKTSYYLNEIKKAKSYASELEIKLKNVQNYQNTNIESKDSIRTEIVFLGCDSIKIKPIEKKHISLKFIQVNDSLDVFYKYNAEIVTIVNREPKKKENGKNHFPNWGFIWGWEIYSNTTIDDQNATIENSVNINFKK